MVVMRYLRFEVLVDPVPLARPRFANGRVYLPQRSRDYRKILQQAAKIAMCGYEPMLGKLFCRLTFYRKFNPTTRNFGDCDNHVKATLDALNGICYVDDSQIISGSFSKQTDKAEPHVVIEVGDIELEKEKMAFEGYKIALTRNLKRK